MAEVRSGWDCEHSPRHSRESGNPDNQSIAQRRRDAEASETGKTSLRLCVSARTYLDPRFRGDDESGVAMRLKGKVAIVTGAGSGIGKASVDLFRQHGATVVGADLHGAEFECDA